MYACPDWDKYLLEKIEGFPTDAFYLSATMIEPVKTTNDCVFVRNFGRHVDDFQERLLLQAFANLEKTDWNGATWPPSLVHRDYWQKVNGYSEEFSPGLYSDPDFSRKLWKAGVRLFCGVGQSKVYHFQSQSLKKIELNDGRRQFLKKWGISANYFYQKYLKMGTEFKGPLGKPNNWNVKYLWMGIQRLFIGKVG
jgi:GT2 family glycosyltransferase